MTVAHSASALPGRNVAEERRRRLLLLLGLLAAALLLMGLAVGSQGWSLRALWTDLEGDQAELLIGQIRAPRTIGAMAVGALLGLSGAIAQGLFRNPLADPYLLGSASGAGLAVVAVLASAELTGGEISLAAAAWLERLGLVVAAFIGALGGVVLTLLLASGAQQTVRLLLAGVVVGVVLGAGTDLLTSVAPDALRGRQAFMLGSTAFLGWPSVLVLAAGLVLALPLSRRFASALDALTLGEDSASSLGMNVPQIRLLLVFLMTLCTGIAVSQAGLVAFVGLASPHLVRRCAPSAHAYLLLASAAMGGVLMLGADVLARGLIAPSELPVGVLTATLGGGYLVWLLRQQRL